MLGNYCEYLRNYGCEDDGYGRYPAADGDVDACIRYQEENGWPFPVIINGSNVKGSFFGIEECWGSPTCDSPFSIDDAESVVYKLQDCRGILIK